MLCLIFCLLMHIFSWYQCYEFGSQCRCNSFPGKYSSRICPTLKSAQSVFHYSITCFDMVYTVVVVFCHSTWTVMGQFLSRAQDRNMTNGDFAFFTFWPQRTIIIDTPWFVYYDRDADDLPRLQRAFYAVKEVRTSQALFAQSQALRKNKREKCGCC